MDEKEFDAKRELARIDYQSKKDHFRVPGCLRGTILLAVLGVLGIVLIGALVGRAILRQRGSPDFDTAVGFGLSQVDEMVDTDAEQTGENGVGEDTAVSAAPSDEDAADVSESEQDAPVAEQNEEEAAPADDEQPVVEPEPESEPEPEPELEPEPEPESTSAVPQQVVFKAAVEGVSVAAYDHYNVGSTSEWVNMPDPHLFVKPGVCGMETEVTTMPAASLPGTNPLEALIQIYEQDYATADSDRTWTLQEEPYELTVQGEPAARLLATRYNPARDRTAWVLFTVIRGATRAALVTGVMSDSCADNPNILADLTNTADSVTLIEQEPVCYVAAVAGSNPPEYGLGCDGVMGTGPDKLAASEYTEVVLGPATWDECAAFMRENEQEGW